MNTDGQEEITNAKKMFGEQVRLKRLKLHLTQEALAKKINVSQGTISRIEKGLQTNLTDRIKSQLLQALDLEMSMPASTVDKLVAEEVSNLTDDQKIKVLRYMFSIKNSAGS